VRRALPAPLPWLAGLLALYLIAPLLAGAQQLTLADWHTVDAAGLARASATSIAAATAATALIALGGIPLGYVLARVPGRAVTALGFLVQLPLALPPLTSGILLLFLLGYASPLGQLTHGALTDSFVGIVLAETFVAAPFLIIAARAAFASMEPALEGVAATLGRTPLQVFLRVSVPVARRTIAAGLLLAWLRAFGEFGATVMVAYHPYSLPVYTYVAFGAQGLPTMLPVLLPTLVLALAIMAMGGVLARPAPPRRALPPVATAAPPPLPAASPTRDPGPELAIDLRRALGAFRLEVQWVTRARRLAILGPSGSGKSLTLKLIAGIEPSDQASLKLGGRSFEASAPAARGIGYVPQSYALFPHLTVLEQLTFAPDADPSRASLWLERFGLLAFRHRYPHELSLGQQQRVALARALVRPARLLLLDEPFSALDAPLRSNLRAELLALQSGLNTTTILVTHDPLEAALLADELLLLEEGQVLQAGPTAEVFGRPASETAARVLGAAGDARGVVVDADSIALTGEVRVQVLGAALSPGMRVGWSVPTAHVRLSATGRYHGVVDGIVPVGLERQVIVRLGETKLRGLAAGSGVRSGSACRFDIDPEAVQVWPLPT
jgi:ABC-type Fe3+/spermidine/putrescine transport system ATPase subunit/ABC-type sulfate transport system permease component